MRVRILKQLRGGGVALEKGDAYDGESAEAWVDAEVAEPWPKNQPWPKTERAEEPEHERTEKAVDPPARKRKNPPSKRQSKGRKTRGNRFNGTRSPEHFPCAASPSIAASAPVNSVRVR